MLLNLSEEADYKFYVAIIVLSAIALITGTLYFFDTVSKGIAPMGLSPSIFAGIIIMIIIIEETMAIMVIFKWNYNLQKRVDEQQQMEDFKEKLINMISHELKTPLTSIKIYSQMLKEGKLGKASEKQRRAGRVMFEDSSRLKLLINKILESAKTKAKKIELSPSFFSFNEAVENAISINAPMIEQKKVKVIKKLPKKKIVLFADREKITTILLNLITNALRFSDLGDRVWVIAKMEGENLVVKVKDEGTGIPKNELPFIFNEFYQVGTSYERKTGGIGLGLHICKAYAEAHGGSINASSVLDRGTVFEFVIPLRQATELEAI